MFILQQANIGLKVTKTKTNSLANCKVAVVTQNLTWFIEVGTASTSAHNSCRKRIKFWELRSNQVTLPRKCALMEVLPLLLTGVYLTRGPPESP